MTLRAKNSWVTVNLTTNAHKPPFARIFALKILWAIFLKVCYQSWSTVLQRELAREFGKSRWDHDGRAIRVYLPLVLSLHHWYSGLKFDPRNWRKQSECFFTRKVGASAQRWRRSGSILCDESGEWEGGVWERECSCFCEESRKGKQGKGKKRGVSESADGKGSVRQSGFSETDQVNSRFSRSRRKDSWWPHHVR